MLRNCITHLSHGAEGALDLAQVREIDSAQSRIDPKRIHLRNELGRSKRILVAEILAYVSDDNA